MMPFYTHYWQGEKDDIFYVLETDGKKSMKNNNETPIYSNLQGLVKELKFKVDFQLWVLNICTCHG